MKPVDYSLERDGNRSVLYEIEHSRIPPVPRGKKIKGSPKILHKHSQNMPTSEKQHNHNFSSHAISFVVVESTAHLK
ncbi:uncharacterized protein EAE97_010346 [Botrytis byssoidea]|uniref:Uncharacterized protein n=1 Tax=Botrytis byssoidea TaxID=139641 RepID=A0A9P5I7X1_9HELO|nr:uncharacterized protein EAE97_010346 [Botrytis byssoidea]KAF7926046.1 hypothetical protein EAE97_010346 [Botrytis byssoidea]